MADFFFDIDGTLLPFGKKAPESAVKAIARLRSEGHRAFLATGRSPAEVPEMVYDIGFDGGVFSAGADVIVNGRRIFFRTMTEEEKSFLLAYSAKRGFRLLVQTETGTYVKKADFDHWVSLMRKYTGSEVALSAIVISETLPSDAEVIKVLYVSDGIDIALVRRELEGRFAVVDNTVGLPRELMGEIVLPGITKATGIDRVVEATGGSISKTAAFGDGANDIEMVEHAEVGIAMGNASDDLKAIADWVAPPVDSDGLAAAIEYALDRLS